MISEFDIAKAVRKSRDAKVIEHMRNRLQYIESMCAVWLAGDHRPFVEDVMRLHNAARVGLGKPPEGDPHGTRPERTEAGQAGKGVLAEPAGLSGRSTGPDDEAADAPPGAAGREGGPPTGPAAGRAEGAAAADPDYEYHMTCRRLCDRLGIVLYGSNTGAGFSAYCGRELIEVPHQLRETLLGLYIRLDGLVDLIRDVAIPNAEYRLDLNETTSRTSETYKECEADLRKLRDAITEFYGVKPWTSID